MFCKYCGKQLNDDARFCTACGKSLVEEAPAEPVYQAPAEPVYQAPAEPVYQAPAEPVYQAPTEPVYQAPAEPVYQTPAEPQYAAPQYQPQTAYAAPAAAPTAAKKIEILPLIAAMVLGLMGFIGMIIAIVNGNTIGVFGNLFTTGAAVLFILTLFGVLKIDNLFYAIGMFALAFVELLYINGFYWWVSLLLIPAFVLAGLYYILKGKLFGNPIKMIMAIAVWVVGLILFIRYCVIGLPAWPIISGLLTSAASGLAIFGYTPYKK